MQKIIVTGGSGYIGSHTCKELALHNYQVVIVDVNESNATKLLVNQYNAQFVQVDITDESALMHALSAHSDAIGGDSFCRPDFCL